MPASVSASVNDARLAVSSLPVPAFLSRKLAAPLAVTASLPIKPLSVQVGVASVVLPSYVLLPVALSSTSVAWVMDAVVVAELAKE